MAIYSGKANDPARIAYLRLMAGAQEAEAADIATYRDYYKGKTGAALTARLAAFLNVRTGKTFCFNHCGLVVNSLRDKLKVTGFACDDQEAQAVLWEWWTGNRMDGQQILIHTSAARDKVSYAIVDWDNEEERPGINFNDAYDGDAGVKVHWAGPPRPGQRILFASKRWRVEFDKDGEMDSYRRLNLYFPDRIEKYRSTGDPRAEHGWIEYWDEGEEESIWPLPWVDAEGKPLGVPVVAFLNQQEGVSELNDVLPLQDGLDKVLVDIIGASDYEGFGIFWKTGGSRVVSGEVHPGALWQDSDPAAKYGKLPAGDLTGLLATLDRFSQAIAVVTRRPLSLFTGSSDAVSGESLKQREAGLVAQAQLACTVFGNAWEDVMRLCVRLDNAFGQKRVREDVTISTQWADVETRNESLHTKSVLDKLAAGAIDQDQAWDELGYSDDEKMAMRRRMATQRAQVVADVVRLTAGGGGGAG